MMESRPSLDRPPAAGDSELFVLRGDDRGELLKRASALSDYLAGAGGAVRPADLAYTLNRSIDGGGVRLALVASSPEELQSRLKRAGERLAENCTQIKDVSGIYYVAEPLAPQGKVAFLFPGEGAQYLGMLDGLADRFPSLQAIYEAVDRCAAEFGQDKRPVSRFTLPPDRWSTSQAQQLEQDLLQIDNAMFSILMADWAVFEVLQQMGVRPDAVAGHSAGELAALVMAGVFEPERHLGALGGTMQALVGRGDSGSALLAVGAPRDVLADVIAAALADEPSQQACVAMDNCPHQSIAVGDASAIGRIETEAIERGLLCERLELGRPYHTHRFEPYMGPLRELFAGVEFRKPSLPVYSCTTGELFPNEPDAIRQLALDHWCAPVEFTRLVRNLYRDGVRIFIEVGPKQNLTSFVDDILRGEPHLAVASNVQHRSAVAQLCHMAAQLVAHHVPLRLDGLYARCAARLVAWEPPASGELRATRSRAAEEKSQAVVPRHPLPGRARQTTSGAEAVMRRHLAMSEQFLDVQAQVMRQFLRRRSALPNRPARRRQVRATAARSPLPNAPPQAAQCDRLPMLGDVVQHERQTKLVVRRILDLREDNYAAHHTVGGRSISRVDPDQHGLPIMPMTFTLEMMMEAAAALLPHMTVLCVKNIRLSRWLAFYEEDRCTIQVSADLLDAPPTEEASEARRQVLVEVKDLGRASAAGEDQGWVAAVGTVVLGDSCPQPPAMGDFPLSHERPCRTDVPTTYNNLFHGELLQGFESVERFGDEGIEGTVRTLPRDRLFASLEAPQFIGDPVLLDAAMHPAVAWHLEQEDQSGRIMLPFELKRLELYGPMPAVGSRFHSRTRIVEETHWHYTHVTEVFDEAGRLWGKIDGIKLWRFYLPFHDVNFHGPKDVYFLCNEWPEAAPTPAAGQADDRPGCCCVRLKELNDLKQPTLQLVAARVMLSPTELQHFLALRRPDDKKAQWLFGRAAAKDAIRILQRKRHGQRPFMADVEILSDDYGRPVARPRSQERPDDYPHVSIAHTAGHVAALAATTPYVGVDIETVVPREAGFVEIAFDESERRLLAGFNDRDEWIARFWCAKEAVGKALGRGLLGGPRGLAVCRADEDSGLVEVTLGTELAKEFPELRGVPLRVNTWRENDLVAATTLCEPVLHTSDAPRASSARLVDR